MCCSPTRSKTPSPVAAGDAFRESEREATSNSPRKTMASASPREPWPKSSRANQTVPWKPNLPPARVWPLFRRWGSQARLQPAFHAGFRRPRLTLRSRSIQIGSMRPLIPAALLAAASFAQTTPNFEVASVKSAAPQAGRGLMRRLMGGPGTPDPGRITYTNVTLSMLLTNAYDVKHYQVTGPAWLDSEGYDITAKIPDGTTREQF